MSNPMYTTFSKQYSLVVKDNIYNAMLERPTTLSLLSIKPGDKVLDLGCGSGEYAKEIQSQGGIMTCIDLSSEMIELTKSNAHPFKAYSQDLSIGLPNEADSSFDWVIAPLIIHYIEDLKPLFSEVSRVLKPDGHFVFSTHHPINDYSISPSGNYFALERITESWDTIGEPVQVSFYRRSLQDLFSAIQQAKMTVCELSEGKPLPDIAKIDQGVYERLITEPSFIFMKCGS
ncbi:SAM-dependent methyltransferase [Vibrio sp. UCD-FRSSP16_10]|uniref:class I SAM-dependent methyltransferase n=1 Tax=unclassified Vibrio TaxID=2614977 RepID=UPI0007FCFA35|nr:SAM-dependent methyltransferase [Vibrio sp. UCD-FRSSP16_30]OBT22149.1 SAM-dependent methyltransferase [Vibrio sp. UCD-FRSSP16_10]